MASGVWVPEVLVARAYALSIVSDEGWVCGGSLSAGCPNVGGAWRNKCVGVTKGILLRWEEDGHGAFKKGE